MSRRPFTPSRADGRSDRLVIFDLATDAEPDTIFKYEDLIDALSEGLPDEDKVQRDRVYRAVAAGNQTLLRERKRYLQVVPDVGYRVIHTSEQLPVALIKKDRAQTYLEKGIELLRYADLSELTAAQRQLHEGQLLIMAGLHQAVRASDQRHARSEQLIAELIKRVDRLEEEGDTGAA
jgi:hypothetical protein